MKWLRERLQEYKDQLEYYCESYGPSVSGILLALIGFVFFSNFTLDCDDLDKIFNLVITLTAITIGFIGVLLGIIATIKERPIIKTFWIINKGNSRKTLEKHFMQSLRFGLGLIVYSIVLIIILKASCVTSANKILVLKIIWCFLLGFSFACFYRVISFVMFVLFAEDNDSRSNDIPENKLIDDERKRELQEKYKK